MFPDTLASDTLNLPDMPHAGRNGNRCRAHTTGPCRLLPFPLTPTMPENSFLQHKSTTPLITHIPALTLPTETLPTKLTPPPLIYAPNTELTTPYPAVPSPQLAYKIAVTTVFKTLAPDT